MTIPAPLQMLRESVQADPALQEKLFLLGDTDSFIAEVLRLAEGSALLLSAEDIRQAMNSGYMNWIERRLP